MRTRNRASALRDKTPGNTPQKERRRASSKDILSSAKKPFPARSIHGRRVDTDEILPRNFLTSQSSFVSPTPAHAPIESTPITRRHHKARLSTTTMRPSMKVPFSPLPPSSPPSSDDEDLPALPSLHSRVEIEEHMDIADEEDVVDENKENEEDNIRQYTEVTVEVEESVDENAPQDDPFGFLAVERDLKVRREMRNRSSVAPVSKGKEVARERAPFKELSFDPSASPSTSRVAPRRPPTPYHPSDDLRESDGLGAPPSDDLEDMYLDPTPHTDAPDAPQENAANRSVGKLQLHREMQAEEDEEEELEEAGQSAQTEHVPEPEPVSVPVPSEPPTPDPLRTPRPHHVANIIPLPSPFSSTEGTPSKDTLPSSPSPVKRPSVAALKPLTTVKKSTWTDRFKAVTASAPPAKPRSHVTVAKENASEDVHVSISNLLDRLPKRPAKRPTKAPAAASASASSTRKAAPARKAKGKQRAEVVESEGAVSDDAVESPDETPLATRKRKATAKAKARFPAKRAKVEVVLPTRRSLRKKPASAAARAKGKGKAAVVPRLEGEDSDEARARQARIEYFKKLDDYEVAKEKVYVV